MTPDESNSPTDIVLAITGASGVFTGSGLLLISAMVIVLVGVRVKPVPSGE